MTKIYEFLAENKDRWTRGVPARNGEGIRVHYNSPKAVCFCLGALIAKFYRIAPVNDLAFLEDEDVTIRLGDAIKAKFPTRVTDWISYISSISHFNDHHETTYEDVLAVCQQAQV